AIGLPLDRDDWSQILAELAWADGFPLEMSRFLCTHLTQPLLVTSLLHHLRCDTLQWNGHGDQQSITGLYATVREHGYRIAHTVTGYDHAVIEHLEEMKSWGSHIDLIVWRSNPLPGETIPLPAVEMVCTALAATQRPWIMTMDRKKIQSQWPRNKNCRGVIVARQSWQQDWGDPALGATNHEHISAWIDILKRLEC
ncbi:MAG: hypothetical protein HQL73_09515, partial [Magnetococcales bacterium]|nr:hypothetical protein [Magnetococcales bacterium]